MARLDGIEELTTSNKVQTLDNEQNQPVDEQTLIYARGSAAFHLVFRLGRLLIVFYLGLILQSVYVGLAIENSLASLDMWE